MTPTPDPLRANRPGHYAIGLRDGGSSWHIGTTYRSKCRTCLDDGWVYRTAQPAPALDVAGEALHTLLAPDLEIQARIEGVQAFVTYVAPGFAPGDAAYLMRAAERYSAIVRGDPA